MSDGLLREPEGVAVAAAAPPAGLFGLVRRLYDWVLHWANTPYGTPALGVLAFAESSFFPVPPDVLLMALCLGVPRRSLRFALVCSVASVLGGVFGYWIGSVVWDQVSGIFFSYVFSQEIFHKVSAMYAKYAFWAVFTAGLTPIPYKVFTIAAGVFQIDFPLFVIASVVSRSARFFAIALLIRRFGAPIRDFIDRYFNLLSIVFVLLLAGGFAVVRWLM
jgi:membrane protein YqaA with SNARE-associated domain